MLKLTYTRKSDILQRVTILSNGEGIRDLYWQLTHNYKCQDRTEIGNITVYNLDGDEIEIKDLMKFPWDNETQLCTLEN